MLPFQKKHKLKHQQIFEQKLFILVSKKILSLASNHQISKFIKLNKRMSSLKKKD